MTTRPHLRHLLAAFALAACPLVLALGCQGSFSGGGGEGGSSGGGCDYGGAHYDVGDSFPAGDGCNTCSCMEDGSAACTLMGCVVTCSYGGQTYEAGTSFPAGDGCNTCSCLDDGGVACTEMGCPTGCTYEGVTYVPGDTFPASDGCNTCNCLETGSVVCTMMPCPGVCTYAGTTYAPGDSFPALDGCNTCSCLDGGQVACTEMACACDPQAEWWREYVALDQQTCAVIDYLCPDNTTGFQNSCGCGCQQDPSCPEWFDCMPPTPCDVEAIKAQCPYSGIAY